VNLADSANTQCWNWPEGIAASVGALALAWVLVTYFKGIFRR
jgi:hypothetical protein